MPKKEVEKVIEEGWGGRKVRSILVVDDNQPAARALAEILSKDGYTIELAHDGDAAIEMANKMQPDVIILDLDLPGKDGYETASILRKKHFNVLLIALSGYYGRKVDKLKARAVGFDHYLTRPILATEIERLFSAPK